MRILNPGSDTPEYGYPRYTAMHYDEGLRLVVPDGYDVKKNVDWAQQNMVTARDLTRALVAALPGSETAIKDSGAPWLKKVGNWGDWDYKRQSALFEDLGNYNAGYTAYYAGLSQEAIEVGAGYYQLKSHTSKLEYVRTYFDDPHDNELIVRGWRDAKAADEAQATRFLIQLLFPEPVERLPVPLEDNGVIEIPSQ